MVVLGLRSTRKLLFGGLKTGRIDKNEKDPTETLRTRPRPSMAHIRPSGRLVYSEAILGPSRGLYDRLEQISWRATLGPSAEMPSVRFSEIAFGELLVSPGQSLGERRRK